jgi:hypothetical protein
MRRLRPRRRILASNESEAGNSETHKNAERYSVDNIMFLRKYKMNKLIVVMLVILLVFGTVFAGQDSIRPGELRRGLTIDSNSFTVTLENSVIVFHGASTAAGERTRLGLGTMAVKDTNNIGDVNATSVYLSGVLGQRPTDYIDDTNDPNATTAFPTAYALKVYDVNGTLMGYVPVYMNKW